MPPSDTDEKTQLEELRGLVTALWVAAVQDGSNPERTIVPTQRLEALREAAERKSEVGG